MEQPCEENSGRPYGRFTIPGETDGFDPADTRFARGDLIVVNLSGRGDKDVAQMMEILEK